MMKFWFILFVSAHDGGACVNDADILPLHELADRAGDHPK